jgi:hypothetical protein
MSVFLALYGCSGYVLAYGCVICCFHVFSFLPVGYLGIYIFVSIGVHSSLCIGILDGVFLVFSYFMWRVCCLHDWLCETDATGVSLHVFHVVMCIVLLSAGVMWNCVC